MKAAGKLLPLELAGLVRLLLTGFAELRLHLWVEFYVSAWNTIDVSVVRSLAFLHCVYGQLHLHVFVRST